MEIPGISRVLFSKNPTLPSSKIKHENSTPKNIV
jgi:hypothetical protein